MDFDLQRTGWGSAEIGGEQGKKKEEYRKNVEWLKWGIHRTEMFTCLTF